VARVPEEGFETRVVGVDYSETGTSAPSWHTMVPNKVASSNLVAVPDILERQARRWFGLRVSDLHIWRLCGFFRGAGIRIVVAD
jgi:hypothetical protein